MKSNPVKVSGKLFRYDFDRSVVEYIIKADAETIDAEIEWEQKHGSQLYGVGADGYIVLASAGLRKENWTNTAARKELPEVRAVLRCGYPEGAGRDDVRG